MNWIKIISVIAGDAILTAIVLGITFYLSEKNNHSSTMLGSASNWAWLGLIIGAVCGLFSSVVSASVITGFRLSTTNAIIFALIFNLILGGVALIDSDGLNNSHTIDFFALVIVGVINAIVFSKLIN